jgi:hypothetical protein
MGDDAFENAAIISYLARTYGKESKFSVSESNSKQDGVDADT